MANLLDTRTTYKPLLYPEALRFWQEQQQIHWVPWEVPLDQDVKDWRTKLSEGERDLLTKLFRFFTQGDIEVANAYTDHYIPVLGGHPEVKMMLLSFANMETIHVKAYANLVETLGMPDTEFTEFLKHKEMMAKYNYWHQETSANNSLEDIALKLAIYSAFTEGLQLFSTFAVLLNFGRHGKLLGMNKIVEWSMRDEHKHVEGMTWLFRALIKENYHIWTDSFKAKIYQTCREMVKLEEDFIDLCFSQVGVLEGLSKYEVKDYVRYIADRRLAQLGLKPNYRVEKNPLPWIEFMLASSHNNFFEQKTTEYFAGDTNGDNWDVF